MLQENSQNLYAHRPLIDDARIAAEYRALAAEERTLVAEERWFATKRADNDPEKQPNTSQSVFPQLFD
jgi:hypothetical protein